MEKTALFALTAEAVTDTLVRLDFTAPPCSGGFAHGPLSLYFLGPLAAGQLIYKAGKAEGGTRFRTPAELEGFILTVKDENGHYAYLPDAGNELLGK